MSALNQIILRDLKSIDIYALVRNANNLKIWKNMKDSFPYPYTLEDAAALVRYVHENSIKVVKAIEFNGDLVGIISLHIEDDVFRYNAEIGYWLGERYWGKGIGKKAVELMTAFGFEELKLNRIYAQVFENNIGSMIILEKNGYQKEGVLRQAIFKDGEFLSNIIYGKLRLIL